MHVTLLCAVFFCFLLTTCVLICFLLAGIALQDEIFIVLFSLRFHLSSCLRRS